MLRVLNGNAKSKMAATNPGVAISRLVHELSTKFQRLRGPSIQMGLTTILYDLTGSAKFKMVATKPELTISRKEKFATKCFKWPALTKD